MNQFFLNLNRRGFLTNEHRQFKHRQFKQTMYRSQQKSVLRVINKDIPRKQK